MTISLKLENGSTAMSQGIQKISSALIDNNKFSK